MIPKLLHQTAKSPELPRAIASYPIKLQRLHPGWTYRLWLDADNLAFVTSEFPDFLETYKALPRNIMRADVIRYLLMYRLGGLYMDTDYEMLKPFDMLDREIVLPWETDDQSEAPTAKICNSFFASRPGHPFWKMMIDDLKANPPLAPDVDVEATTGPGFITKIYQRARKQGMDLYAPARPIFNPFTPRGPRQYRAILKEGVAYGIHHTQGTWREYSLPRRIKRRLGEIVYRFTS